jgi:hypothetical protein
MDLTSPDGGTAGQAQAIYHLELVAPGNHGACEADTINGDILAFINS